MSQFNKCKHRGQSEPKSGWVTSFKSPCNECTDKINEAKAEYRLKLNEDRMEALRSSAKAEGTLPRSMRGSMARMMAMTAAILGGKK
jgi:hypothetical protein